MVDATPLPRVAAVALRLDTAQIDVTPPLGEAVKLAEAFETCEYGWQPTPAEIKQLFPYFP
jgi:hypothetical protein